MIKKGGLIKSVLIDFIGTPYFLVDLYLFLYEFLAISLGWAVAVLLSLLEVGQFLCRFEGQFLCRLTVAVLRKAGSLPILMDGLPVNAESHGSSP